MVKIMTHQNVNFDVCLSIWMIQTFINTAKIKDTEISFIGDNANPDSTIKTFILGITPLRAVGFANITIIDHNVQPCYDSTSQMVFEHYKEEIPRYLEHLIEHANDSARAGHTLNRNRLELLNIPYFMSFGRKKDIEIVRNLSPMFDGYFSYISSLSKAKEFIEKNVKFWNNTIAYYDVGPDECAIKANCVLFNQHKVELIVAKQGNNTVILRNRLLRQPNLTCFLPYVEEEEDGWKAPDSGFMVSRGTWTYPIDTPSKYSIDELLALVIDVFYRPYSEEG